MVKSLGKFGKETQKIWNQSGAITHKYHKEMKISCQFFDSNYVFCCYLPVVTLLVILSFLAFQDVAIKKNLYQASPSFYYVYPNLL